MKNLMFVLLVASFGAQAQTQAEIDAAMVTLNKLLSNRGSSDYTQHQDIADLYTEVDFILDDPGTTACQQRHTEFIRTEIAAFRHRQQVKNNCYQNEDCRAAQ